MIHYLLPSRLLSSSSHRAASRPDVDPADASSSQATSVASSPYADAIANACQKAWPQIRMAAWLSLPIGLLGLLPSIFLLQVFNRVISRGGTATLTAMVAGVLCFLGIEWWLRIRRALSLREAGATIDHDVSQALMDSMLQRPLLALESRPSSQWLQLFRDIPAMRASISGGLASAIFDLPMALLALIVIGIIAWPVLPVIIVAMIVLGVLAWWWADEVRSGRVEELVKARALDRSTAEVCHARTTLKALAHDATIKQNWQQGYDFWLGESFRKNGDMENARETSIILLTLFSIAVITVGAIAINEQWMSIGSLMAVNLLASKALSPVAQLAGNWRSLARSNEATRRLQKALEEPVENAPPQTLQLPRPKGRFHLDQVSFHYPTGQTPLENVTLDIGPGGLHAIVGRNGAGKSTLGKLLAGLYQPTEGTIYIDEYDMAQFSRSDLGHWVGCLAQQVYWFSGTIIEGLRMVNAQADDQTIVRACQLTGAHAFISHLPQGYQTVVGEGGTGLSAGELRKLALAQMFLRNPSVLVLDEPSSDLDFDSETALLKNLQHIAQKLTVIVITHSVRVASVAQHIYHVRGDGHVEHGTPQQLLPQLYGSAYTPPPATATPPTAHQNQETIA